MSVPGQSEFYTQWLAGLRAVERHTGRHTISGNALWINTVDQSVQQIAEARRYGVDWAGYANNGLTYAGTHKTRAAERAAFVKAMRGGPFKSNAAIPAMPWKAANK